LIIGAARSGTTSLYSALQSHPDVYLPRNKRPEPHFFLKESEFTKGLGYYEQRYFSEWHGQRAVGEASTSYLYGPDVPRRIDKALPGAKVICVLRDPVERAFSGYWHTVRSGLEALSFDEALAMEESRKQQLAGTAMGEIAPFAYVERGLYHQQLTRWFDVFDRNRVCVVLFEELVSHPSSVLTAIADFLGVDRNAFAAPSLGKENTSVPGDASMSAETRRALVERFRGDIRALETLLGRDLSDWLMPSSSQAPQP
jgi:hypothetical protein